MNKLEIAEQARYKIESGQGSFLCLAVMKVCAVDSWDIYNASDEFCRDEAVGNYPEAAFVFERIKKKLEGYSTFDGMHKAKGLPGAPQNLRAARVAFMNELIKEWGGEEDE